ncbi:xanthine dehydrogenase family protein subunit M [Nocardioides sp. LMS-CY]|uniref:FAD binding domain-containing protein n=1 Tax=Nocardioides sp. (strain LMS-CY) TaxID=2840457 RepID=UPI001C00465B|nr:xanthine dehydrogenase family protein subunit M [Nocardioides sp. LMS-CY]QWF22128.1 xanthine dehydrogenase family protein subunit M [Nocardioides sp. LMS-CY]
MKPPPFDYTAPRSLGEALRALADAAGDGKVIAGGQSLVPLMNFRFARPGLLVDVNRIPELTGIRRRDGELRIGATTRQADAEQSGIIARGWPLLHQALPHVAHQQIRNRGTVGGSVAHADPAAEICSVLLAYGGRVEVASVRGVREIDASDLFVGQFVTTIEADEILTAVVVPPPPAGTGTAFHEVARRHGDFALAGAAAAVTTDDRGRCERASLCLLGAAPTPICRAAAEAHLVGNELTDAVLAEAVALATADIEPPSDVHGSSAYRTRAAREMAARALTEAFARSARDRGQRKEAS